MDECRIGDCNRNLRYCVPHLGGIGWFVQSHWHVARHGDEKRSHHAWRDCRNFVRTKWHYQHCNRRPIARWSLCWSGSRFVVRALGWFAWCNCDGRWTIGDFGRVCNSIPRGSSDRGFRDQLLFARANEFLGAARADASPGVQHR